MNTPPKSGSPQDPLCKICHNRLESIPLLNNKNAQKKFEKTNY